METAQQTVIPVLRIFDTAKTKEFYVDWLGFSIDWEHRFGENFPLYMQVSKDNIKLHLSEHHGDCSPGAKVLIHLSGGLADYQASLTAKDYRYFKPGLEEAHWGALTMNLTDPFGNHLLFSEDIKNKG